MTKQDIEFVRKRYTHVESLVLADRNFEGKDLEVNVLIGLHFYHESFTGNVKRELGKKSSCPENEIRMGFEWSYECTPLEQHCFSTQYILRVEVEKEKDPLREELSRFWEVESTSSKGPFVIDDVFC